MLLVLKVQRSKDTSAAAPNQLFRKKIMPTAIVQFYVPFTRTRIRRGIIRHAALWALCRYRHKAHWGEVRTGWDHDKNGYALGELAAEIASCYVAAELGVPQGEGLGNHAAYLRHWLDAMKGDRNFIFRAAKQAGKVTDFLLGFVRKPEPEAAVTA
jgi:hypothetical protein